MVERLVERIRNHDQRAMSELYQRYVGALTSVCYRYVPSESDAKDVLQNSFVKIFTALPTFDYRDEPSFKNWMVKVVVNESLHFLRGHKRIRLTDLHEADKLLADEGEQPDMEKISAEELHRLIRELPDGYRTVVNLYVFEGYSHEQIAALLGIKEATSSSQFYYAKRLLAKKIRNLKR
ncbi:MAG: sigma-70 family RNA polymerase sigma factor [Prevotella sp.]|nr:sigma-70 family RNA polymerase sigma factor [Prevotella sp.]